jgi:DNA-binding transcriptional regulator YhcF (GntR family)
MSDDSNHTKWVNLIGEAVHEAAKAKIEELESEIPEEELHAVLGASLVIPAVNYLRQIGATKEQILNVVSNVFDDYEADQGDEEEESPQLKLLN